MGDLATKLQEELTCETAFKIGGIGIAESTVITWVIMAVLLLFAILMTRNLKVCTVSDNGSALYRSIQRHWFIWFKTTDKRPECDSCTFDYEYYTD